MYLTITSIKTSLCSDLVQVGVGQIDIRHTRRRRAKMNEYDASDVSKYCRQTRRLLSASVPAAAQDFNYKDKHRGLRIASESKGAAIQAVSRTFIKNIAAPKGGI